MSLAFLGMRLGVGSGLGLLATFFDSNPKLFFSVILVFPFNG